MVKAYSVYVALLTQTGTDAPEAVVKENTLGDVDWTYDGVGVYFGTKANAFPADSTVVFCGMQTADGLLPNQEIAIARRIDNNTIEVMTGKTDGSGTEDNQLRGTAIDIRVYL